jgi:hypothetical protein
MYGAGGLIVPSTARVVPVSMIWSPEHTWEIRYRKLSYLGRILAATHTAVIANKTYEVNISTYRLHWRFLSTIDIMNNCRIFDPKNMHGIHTSVPLYLNKAIVPAVRRAWYPVPRCLMSSPYSFYSIDIVSLLMLQWDRVHNRSSQCDDHESIHVEDIIHCLHNFLFEQCLSLACSVLIWFKQARMVVILKR